MNSLKEKYEKEIIPELTKKHNYTPKNYSTQVKKLPSNRKQKIISECINIYKKDFPLTQEV